MRTADVLRTPWPQAARSHARMARARALPLTWWWMGAVPCVSQVAFIEAFLVRDPTHRLGNHGAAQVMAHDWLASAPDSPMMLA